MASEVLPNKLTVWHHSWHPRGVRHVETRQGWPEDLRPRENRARTLAQPHFWSATTCRTKLPDCTTLETRTCPQPKRRRVPPTVSWPLPGCPGWPSYFADLTLGLRLQTLKVVSLSDTKLRPGIRKLLDLLGSGGWVGECLEGFGCRWGWQVGTASWSSGRRMPLLHRVTPFPETKGSKNR